MINEPQNFLKSPEVCIVEASAGSGKTYALAKRYVQLLLYHNPQKDFSVIQSILALTFTNKAAFEMKGRILDFLKSLALEKMNKNQLHDIIDPIGLSPKQASERAFLVMDRLIHHYNFFQVETIDKFINTLLSGCSFKIGLTANFKIKTNSKEYLEYSLDQLIDQATTDKDVYEVFVQFLHNYLYLENRSGWFVKDDILAITKGLFAQTNTYGMGFNISPFSSEELIKLKKVILKDMNTLRKELPEGTNKGFVKSLEKFLLAHTKGFDVDQLSEYFARDSVPVNKKVQVSFSLESLWERITDNIRILINREAFSLYNPYIIIFDLIQQKFNEMSAHDDVLFLEELNKKAQTLFEDHYVSVAELYYRLATRFRHYLIDEFQDTSLLQWKNLQMMVEEGLSTGGSFFYVGDRKQAIYGFRGGEVRLFDAVKESFKRYGVDINVLDHNWRSHKNIVEFNNMLFSMENLKVFLDKKFESEKKRNKKNLVEFHEKDLDELSRVFQSSHQHFQPHNDQGYVRTEYIEAANKEAQDEIVREKLIRQIADLNKRFKNKDIAILTRGNMEIERITAWLLEEGIQVESERTLNVKENYLIGELVAFLNFLVSPIDNIAFVQFILGDLFLKAACFKKQDMHDFVFSLRPELTQTKSFYVYIAFREKYPQEWQNFIEPFFKNVGLYSLYELVVSVYQVLNCLDNFPDHQAFLMHFLELIKKQESDFPDVESFLGYFDQYQGEELYVKTENSDAIKILTIHKSKGLEFPVVLIPSLGMDVQVGFTQDNRQSYVLQETSGNLDLLRLKEKYYSFSDELYAIYAQKYKEAFVSELDNIYVALTRAKQELHLYVPRKISGKFNLVQLLIPEGQLEWGVPSSYKANEQKNEERRGLKPPQYHNWIDYLQDEFLAYKDLRNRDVKYKGRVIHYILSFVGNLSQQSLDQSLEEALSMIETVFPNIENAQDYIKLIEGLIHQKSLKPFFYVPDGQVLTEQEMVNEKGELKRLDRLILKADEVWIIDYKSSKDESGRIEKQMREYVDLVKQMYPKKNVKSFFIYLDEISYQESLGAV